MLKTSNGTCIRMDGKLYFCIEFLHVKPGKGTLSCVPSWKMWLVDTSSNAVSTSAKNWKMYVWTSSLPVLIQEGEDYIFMGFRRLFDQHPIAHDLINGVDFLLRGHGARKLFPTLLPKPYFMPTCLSRFRWKSHLYRTGIERRYGNQYAETRDSRSGATVRVPLFISEGETIEIDTRDGSYT